MDVFAVLADPVRRDLLRTLSRGPARVVDLAAAYPISRPAISKHLRLLTEADLCAAADHGRERHYSLTSDGLRPVVELVEELRPDEVADCRPDPPLGEHALDGLALEVRRVGRDRRSAAAPATGRRANQPSTGQEETA